MDLHKPESQEYSFRRRHDLIVRQHNLQKAKRLSGGDSYCNIIKDQQRQLFLAEGRMEVTCTFQDEQSQKKKREYAVLMLDPHQLSQQNSCRLNFSLERKQAKYIYLSHV